MEVGAPVWVRDKDGDEAWVAGTVLEKSSSSPCKVQIEVDEEFSEEPLTFTFSADDGEPQSTDVSCLLHNSQYSFAKKYGSPVDRNEYVTNSITLRTNTDNGGVETKVLFYTIFSRFPALTEQTLRFWLFYFCPQFDNLSVIFTDLFYNLST